MTHRSVHTTLPLKPARNFNAWRKFIQRQLDKINGTDIASKMR